ncbi:ribonuclease H-like domain-containing protein [Mycena rosella]|uniref:Ribonuclease H-like domain-containing protein n=1 Tax=Mycena rosella TaxID=1033263 RepID=A0AAD7GUQ2_MYCRO|nr:ribonuclease H-like domain-containing protein [Mycena rosella]
MSSTKNSIVLVDTILLLHACLDALADTTSLAVDLEGVALCRSGTLCIIQLKAAGSDTIYLVDVTVLHTSAFEEVSANGHSLKSIFESRAVKKLFFDVRNDSDALYNLFGVTLANVYDLQLLEVAVRSSKPGRPPRFVKGLVSSLETYVAPLKSSAVVRDWTRVKEAGLLLFAPERGGRYEVFEDRPLPAALKEYCAQDVALLHELESALSRNIGRNWDQRVRTESAVRVAFAKKSNYTPRGPDKALVPTNW